MTTESIRLTADASVDEVVGQIERDGFAIVEGVLSPKEVAEKRADLIRVLQSTPTGRNDFEGFKTQRIYALFAKTRVMDGPATHPLVLGVLDRLLGHYQLSAPVGISIGPGETAQVLHCDDGIYPLPRPHQEVVVNTMWPFDPFTRANGATRVVPGSHRWTDKRPDDSSTVVDAEMEPGSMKALQLVVADAAAARETLAGRGVEVTDLQVIAPADGGTFFGFSDPDGNSWAVQEIKARARTPLLPNDHSGLREWAGR